MSQLLHDIFIQILFVFFNLKFKFNWTSCIYPGKSIQLLCIQVYNPYRQVGWPISLLSHHLYQLSTHCGGMVLVSCWHMLSIAPDLFLTNSDLESITSVLLWQKLLTG